MSGGGVGSEEREQIILKGKVKEVVSQKTEFLPGPDIEQTIQIFLLSEDGTIIEGKTRAVKVSKDIKTYLKKFGSIGSLLGGLAVPLAKILPSMLAV